MSNGFATDMEWSSKHIGVVKNIVGPRLLIQSDPIVDRVFATDLVVLRARDMNIAVRIRRFGYWGMYPGQFTLRKSRDSGAETEFSKIVRGFCDWMFYGHAGQQEGSVAQWVLIDLNQFRYSLIRMPFADMVESKLAICTQNRNRDGTPDGTSFCAFSVGGLSDLCTGLVIDAHDKYEWCKHKTV